MSAEDCQHGLELERCQQCLAEAIKASVENRLPENFEEMFMGVDIGPGPNLSARRVVEMMALLQKYRRQLDDAEKVLQTYSGATGQVALTGQFARDYFKQYPPKPKR